MAHIKPCGDDVIKKGLRNKRKGRKKESHTFGLRKEGRKFPPIDRMMISPKGGEKGPKEKGENEEK